MKSTVNKMIPFKQRESSEKHKNSKYKINNANVINTSKVIAYPKYKKRKEKGIKVIKVIKNNKPLLIIICLLLFFALLSFIDNVVLKDKYSSIKKTTKSEINTSVDSVSEIEFEASSKVIKNKIKNTLSLSGRYFIDTKKMHKNGNITYAQGDISLGKNKTKYFDMILKDKVPYSLVIDGSEYIK